MLRNFDLTDGYNILRIICGAFLLPHLYAKASNLPFAFQLYKEWRLEPAKAWVYTAIVVEVLCAIGLIFGIYTRYAAILCAVFLLVATWAVWRQSGGKWIWNIGGLEYPLFWAICCIVVAMKAP
jgi:putative oxidoreductase